MQIVNMLEEKASKTAKISAAFKGLLVQKSKEVKRISTSFGPVFPPSPLPRLSSNRMIGCVTPRPLASLTLPRLRLHPSSGATHPYDTSPFPKLDGCIQAVLMKWCHKRECGSRGHFHPRTACGLPSSTSTTALPMTGRNMNV